MQETVEVCHCANNKTQILSCQKLTSLTLPVLHVQAESKRWCIKALLWVSIYVRKQVSGPGFSWFTWGAETGFKLLNLNL